MSDHLPTQAQVHDLLKAAQIDSHSCATVEIFPLPGGRNNRVYRIEADRHFFLLKHYYREQNGSPNRLLAEFEFSNFLWQSGLYSIPQPLGILPAQGQALYAYISGRRMLAAEVTGEHVDAAMDFFCAMNQHRDLPLAAALPLAAEACFSLEDHFRLVGQRVQRLCLMPCGDKLDEDVRDWANDELRIRWERVVIGARERARQLALPIDEVLRDSDRCVSPSDFGFHNAILSENRGLVFHDFEYAGWDDPAKALADFFCQPELPAPPATQTRCYDRILTELRLPERHRNRFHILAPVYRVKWWCIVLNEFLSNGRQRRDFAAPCQADTRQRQFDLAQRMAASSLVPEIIAHGLC